MQNIFLEKPIKDFLASSTVLRQLGRKDSITSHWIVETTPNIWCALESSGRVDFGRTSQRILHYLAVTQYLRWKDFGHTSIHCRVQQDVSGHCAKPAYKVDVCPKKT